jgi:hypothetical protein
LSEVHLDLLDFRPKASRKNNYYDFVGLGWTV